MGHAGRRQLYVLSILTSRRLPAAGGEEFAVLKRFLKILSVFLLPIVLLYGLFAGVLYSTRELAGLDAVVNATVQGDLVLYGTAHHENFAAYKLRVTQQLAPRLLVLGTSRSMQLRSEFFSEPSFYNAGGAVRTMADYEDFLRNLPQNALPDTLLVVLDQNMFNTTWRESSPTDPQTYGDLPNDSFATLLRTGFDYGNHKFSIVQNLLPRAGIYGLAAAAKGMGFAADGSYRYGTVALQNTDEPEKNFATTYRDIDFGELRFAPGTTPDELALAQLDSLLAFCSSAGIHVVGFLPPFPPAVNAKMQASGQYGYISGLYAAIAPRFAAVGGEFYDFTQMQNTTDNEYIDGFHGGDRVYAKITLALAQESTLLAPLLAPATTEALLNAPSESARVLADHLS